MITVWTSLLPPVIGTLLGVGLAIRRPVPLRAGLSRVLQGLLIVFALGYAVCVLNDLQYARTYWPETPLAHVFGPNWAADLFKAALGQFSLSGPLLLGAFLTTRLMRRGTTA